MPFEQKGWHHFYLGVILIVSSVVPFVYGNGLLTVILITLGGCTMLDDLGQHWMGWRTPLARLSSYLYPKFTEIYKFFDRMFGK